VLDLGAERNGRCAAFRVAVDVAHTRRAQGACEGDRVKGNRGCCAAHDQHLGARMLGELGADGAISVARVVREGAERAGSAIWRRQEHVISGRNRKDIRHCPAVASTRLTESKRTPRSGAVRVTRAEAPVTASRARSARDLKRDEYPLADAAHADLVPNRDHLSHRLVPDREGPGEEAHRRHRLVEITTRDRERTHERAPGVRGLWFRNVLPGDPPSLEEGELAHRREVTWEPSLNQRGIGCGSIVSRLRVYNRVGAGRPIRVVWALEEVGADYELVTLSAEEARSAEHRARHPLGRVPVLEDEQGPMFESTALVFHVAELYPEAELVPPPATHERALVQGWSIFGMTELEAPAIESYRQREANAEASAKAAARCADAVAVLEGALAGTPAYLVGSRFSVADIVARGVLDVAVRVGAIEPSPTTAAYMESLAARPARQRAVSKLDSHGAT
jgi:glutathione S-transferase